MRDKAANEKTDGFAVRFLLRALRALDSRSVSGIHKPSFARLVDTDAKSQRAVLARWFARLICPRFCEAKQFRSEAWFRSNKRKKLSLRAAFFQESEYKKEKRDESIKKRNETARLSGQRDLTLLPSE